MSRIITFGLILTMSIFSCKKDGTETVTIIIETAKKNIIVGSHIQLNCKFNNDNNGKISYQWSSSSGTFGLYKKKRFIHNNTLDSNIIIWHAPYQTGIYQITCTATNLDSKKVEKSTISLQVNQLFYSQNKTIYSSPRLINDLKVTSKDSLFTYNISFYNTERTIRLLNDECLLIENSKTSIFSNLSLCDNSYYSYYNYSNSWIADTIGSIIGSRPEEIQVKIDRMGDYIYMSNYFNPNTINAINVKTRGVFYLTLSWNQCRLLDIKSNKNDELFGITSPRYGNGGSSLVIRPALWNMMKNFGTPEKVFEFPDGYDYEGHNLGDGFPLSIKYDMAFDSKNNLYIAMPYTGKIFLLDTANNFKVFKENIFCPSSIAIADNDYIYITSPARFSFNNGVVRMIKPLEIIYLDENGNTVSITSIPNDYSKFGGSLKFLPEWGCYFMSSSVQNDIAVDEDYNVYFIDSNLGIIKIFN